MHTIRYIKACYFAAFVLGAVIAFLVSAPLRAEDGRQSDAGARSELASGSFPGA